MGLHALMNCVTACVPRFGLFVFVGTMTMMPLLWPLLAADDRKPFTAHQLERKDGKSMFRKAVKEAGLSVSPAPARKVEPFSSVSVQLQVFGEAAPGLPAGVRLDLPVSPLRVDYGVPIPKPRDDAEGRHPMRGPLDGPGPGYQKLKGGGMIPGLRG